VPNWEISVRTAETAAETETEETRHTGKQGLGQASSREDGD